MSGFVANTPEVNEAEIPNVFWPAISPATLRKVFSIKQDISPEQLSHLTTVAIIKTNDELKTFTIKEKAGGNENSSDLEDGQRLNTLYKHAVYSTVMADILDHSRTYDSTASGRDDAEDLQQDIDSQRRNASISIRSILGLSRSNVELI